MLNDEGTVPSLEEETERANRNAAKEFWWAFADGRADVAQECLNQMSILPLTVYNFDEEGGLPGIGTYGKYVTGLTPDTPGATMSAWNSNERVKLEIFDSNYTCRGRIGTGTRRDFQTRACRKGECVIGLHKDTLDRMPFTGSARAIKCWVAAKVTKPRIFSRPHLS